MTQPTNNLQFSPYLKTQWQFPYDEVRSLSNQVDIAYIDIASKVNSRTVGIFATNFPLVTGNRYYLSGSSTPQQTLRQVYEFTAAGNIPHGIDFASITDIPVGFGDFTDGANFYGCIFGSSVAIAGQVSFYVTPTNIVVLSGVGAPVIVNGTIVLEWLSQV